MSRAKDKQKRKAARAADYQEAALPTAAPPSKAAPMPCLCGFGGNSGKSGGIRAADDGVIIAAMGKTKKAAAIPPDKTGAALLAAACAVLVLAYFATLGGIADGTIDMHLMFSSDNPRVWLTFQMWLSDPGSLWQSRWSPSNYFLDLVIMWPLYWIFDYVVAGFIFPPLTAMMSAAGWILLSAALFGNNPRRAAFIIVAHALPFLYMGWFGNDVFAILLLPVYHTTGWMSMPWLLWLAARSLQTGGRGFTIAFSALTAVSILCDPIMAPWFCAPLAVALLLMFYADANSNSKKRKDKERDKSRYMAVFVAMIIGIIIGYLASKAVPFADRFYGSRVYSPPPFRHIIDTIGNLLAAAGLLAKGNPAGAIVWIVFVVIAARKFLISLPSKLGTMEIPLERRCLFLFVPLSMAATAGAVVVTGLFPFISVESFLEAGGFGGKRYMEVAVPERAKTEIIRYLLPLLLFPLFSGWAVYAPALRAPVVGAALFAVAILAIPKAAMVTLPGINPYSHPFYGCMHQAAEQHNAKGVISSVDGRQIFAYPHWRWDSYISAGVARGGERSFVYMDDTYRANIKEASYDFVVTNADRGEFSFGTPGRHPFTCSYDNWHQCIVPVHSPAILDGQAIRGAFGEPQNIIHCPGNSAIYHYNPPIVLRDIAHGRQAGGIFSAKGWTRPTD